MGDQLVARPLRACPEWLWECRSWWNKMVLAGETEVFGENLHLRHFVHHKSHLIDPDANPDRRGGKPATNRFRISHFKTFGSQMAARLSALCVGHFLLPGRFLVLHSVRSWVDPTAIVRLEGLGQLKISTSSGTRTGDLPACSIVPQPTTLPRAPIRFSPVGYYEVYNLSLFNIYLRK
jgi:hypothetical protein